MDGRTPAQSIAEREHVKQIIADYLYGRDDIMDGNEVDDVAKELSERLVVL